MIRALARKELRELRPWAVLAVVVWIIDLIDDAVRKLDQRPLSLTFHGLSDTSVGMLWLLAFAIGTTLGTREEDDGTLSFLDGLPVTRHRVFAVKFAMATAVLFTYPVLKVGLAIGLHLVSRGSLDSEVHVGLLVQLLGLELLLVISGLAFGAALGRLRSLTWLVAGALAVGLSLLVEQVPRASLLDPMTLAEVQTHGVLLRFDTEALGVQAALAALWLVVAWAGFVGSGRPRFTQLSNRPVVSAVVTLLTVSLVVTAMVVRSRRGGDDRPKGGAAGEGQAEPEFPESPPASTSTTHYRFSYPALQSRDALALAESADEVFEEVHRLLQVPPGEVIDVDASGSMRGTDGTAFYGGLRLALGVGARGVLAHETSHVVARRVAGDDRAWLWSRAKVLNEGLASWVQRRFDPREEHRREDQLVLAALHRRGELQLSELVDPVALSRERDDLLAYTAGEALIDATVRVYGVEALPRLLSAFANRKLPPDLEHLQLWQACFQLAGMDLGRVVDEFFRAIEAQEKAQAEVLMELPRPRVVLIKSGTWYGARAMVNRPLDEDWKVVLRFRPGPESDLSTYDTYALLPGERQWREAQQIRKGQICVQAGVRLPEGNALYEPWACLPVSDAIDED